jgi:DNA-binding CsgD family transcriptional regulator
MLGLPAAGLLHQDIENSRYGFDVAAGVDPSALQLYGRYFGRIDPWRASFLHKREGELTLAEDLCPTSTLRKTEFHNDYLAKYGMTLYCSVATLKRETHFEIVSVHRFLNRAPPGPDTLKAIDLIAPHIGHALRIRRQLVGLEMAALTRQQVFDSLRIGILLIDAHGDCVLLNRAAEAICAAGDSLRLTRNRLEAANVAQAPALRRLIMRALDVASGKIVKPAGPLCLIRACGSLHVTAFPLTAPGSLVDVEGSQAAVAAILIRDSEQESVTLPQMLRATYGLTAAEAKLAMQLFRGCTLSQAAEISSLSIETVRSQLKSAFQKTYSTRQAQFLMLMAGLARAMG